MGTIKAGDDLAVLAQLCAELLKKGVTYTAEWDGRQWVIHVTGY